MQCMSSNFWAFLFLLFIGAICIIFAIYDFSYFDSRIISFEKKILFNKNTKILDEVDVSLENGSITSKLVEDPSLLAQQEEKIILGWTKFVGKTLEGYFKEGIKDCVSSCVLKVKDLNKCPYKCRISSNHNDLKKAKLVVYHDGEINTSDLPHIESNQINIFFTQESPYHGGKYKNVPANFFNATMTYRLDSDVVIPYDKSDPIDKNTKDDEKWTWEEVKEKVNKKSKMVLQFVSHCSTPSKRENYIKELAKYIDVKIYGRCSANSDCNKECEKNEIDQYMFYLSFENSICKDYVTEKFWRLKQLIVPIVMNREIHQHIAPNGSFIAASDFKSPKELANFLKQLASNKEEYIKYFNWTKNYKKTPATVDTLCELCKLAHTRNKANIDDIKRWWEADSKCINDYGNQLL